MEHLPPVGWADVATKRDLDLLGREIGARFEGVDARFDAVDARFGGVDARLGQVEQRLDRLEQTVHSDFRTTLWAMMGTMSAVGGLVVAAIKL